MSIPIREAVILWHDDSARVGVTTQVYGVFRYERENGGTFWNSDGQCNGWWDHATDAERLQSAVEIFVHMIDVDGVDETAARRAFFAIDEWRNSFADSQALDAAVRVRRAEVEIHGPGYMIARGAPLRQYAKTRPTPN